MRTFYPRKTITINASAPHPQGTQYKVSLGDEHWGDGTFQSVVKVQMMYDGKVAGRMSPSYPVGTDDFARVSAAINELETGHSSENIYMIPTELSSEGILNALYEILGLVGESTSSEKMRYLGQYSWFVSYKKVSLFDHLFYRWSDDVKLLCDRKPEEGYPLCDKIISILSDLETDDDFFPEYLIDHMESIKHLHDNE